MIKYYHTFGLCPDTNSVIPKKKDDEHIDAVTQIHRPGKKEGSLKPVIINRAIFERFKYLK